MNSSYYERLGVPTDASPQQIKHAYRKAAMRTHPDKHPPGLERSRAEEEFKAISEAYEILSDPYKRAQYDRGSLRSSNIDLSYAQDLFNAFFSHNEIFNPKRPFVDFDTEFSSSFHSFFNQPLNRTFTSRQIHTTIVNGQQRTITRIQHPDGRIETQESVQENPSFGFGSRHRIQNLWST